MKKIEEKAQRGERVECAYSELLSFLDAPPAEYATGKLAGLRLLVFAAEIASQHVITADHLASECAKALLTYRKSGGTADDFDALDVDRRVRRERKRRTVARQ